MQIKKLPIYDTAWLNYFCWQKWKIQFKFWQTGINFSNKKLMKKKE